MGKSLKDVIQAAASELEFLSTKDQLNVIDHNRHRRLIVSLRSALAQLTKQDRETDDGDKFASSQMEKSK